MFFKKVIDFIFPPVCGICGKPIKNNTNTCLNCLSILQYDTGRIMKGHGRDAYDLVLSLYSYQGMIKKQLLNFKFHQQKYVKYSLAELMAKRIQALSIKFDIIIPVPISQKRFYERGFNQSLEIAKELARIVGKPVSKQVLIKTKNNFKQSKLKKYQRKKNVEGVYQIRYHSRIQNKVILLIDDIVTTGATVSECAKVLKENGAQKVIVITIAYA